DLLNGQVCDFAAVHNGQDLVTLTPTNDAAATINTAFLERLNTPEHVFDATVAGKFPESAYPTDASLRLRVGARVILLRNDAEKRWVNGTLATICSLSPNRMGVRVDGGSHMIERHTWENVEYVFDEREQRIKERVVGTFQQYPVRLAWAMTIHKSQGQTFDR